MSCFVICIGSAYSLLKWCVGSFAICVGSVSSGGRAFLAWVVELFVCH
jgi:hypothetical protein